MRIRWTGVRLMLAACAIALATTAAASAADQKVRGRLDRIDADDQTVTVKTADGKALPLTVTPRTRLEVDGKPVTLKQFREGQRVRAWINRDAGRDNLVRLTASAASADDVARNAKETLQSIRQYTYENKDEYAAKLRNTLDDLDDRVDELHDRAARAGAEARKELGPELEQLKEKRQAVARRLEKVDSASEAAWTEVRDGLNQAADDFRDAWDKFRSRIK